MPTLVGNSKTCAACWKPFRQRLCHAFASTFDGVDAKHYVIRVIHTIRQDIVPYQFQMCKHC